MKTNLVIALVAGLSAPSASAVVKPLVSPITDGAFDKTRLEVAGK